MKSFQLVETKKNGIRIGEIKGKRTPRFFMINNFGGGGTNVSRFFVYSPLFAEGSSEILLNYYYLNTRYAKTPSFNTDILKEILSSDDIKSFLEQVRHNLIEIKRNCLKGTKHQPMEWNPLVLLDSGSGNIFRDILIRLNEENFNEVYLTEIRNYVNFCEKLRFDIAIGLDIAGKYTWKKGETTNEDYRKKLKTFSESKWNLKINEMFLKEIPQKPTVSYYAAIHGNQPDDYLNYLDSVLSIENMVNRKYFGFAIGNLGNSPRPSIYKTVKLIRDKLNKLDDDRPIHILGVGSVQNIIPLSLNGADTFDCHSPWRRASEDKFIIPLFDSNFKVVAEDESYWQYIPIDQIDTLKCDCDVCRRSSISELIRLKNGSREEKYFFRILGYKHNIHQQEILCELVRSDINLQNLINYLPESNYKRKLSVNIAKAYI